MNFPLSPSQLNRGMFVRLLQNTPRGATPEARQDQPTPAQPTNPARAPALCSPTRPFLLDWENQNGINLSRPPSSLSEAGQDTVYPFLATQALLLATCAWPTTIPCFAPGTKLQRQNVRPNVAAVIPLLVIRPRPLGRHGAFSPCALGLIRLK